jgi:galactokinase
VALLEAASGDDFARRVAADYQQRTGHTPAVYVCQATNGAEVFGGDKTCGDLPSG